MIIYENGKEEFDVGLCFLSRSKVNDLLHTLYNDI